MVAWGLYFAEVAHAAQACADEIMLGRKLTPEEDGAIWAEVFAQVKVALGKADAEAVLN
jgi:hypothetical protein